VTFTEGEKESDIRYEEDRRLEKLKKDLMGSITK